MAENIPMRFNGSVQIDMHSKSNINLFAVTLEDVLEYLMLLSEKSMTLDTHLSKYGTDEECIYKWNERLRLISVTLGLEGCVKLFDPKVDRQDLMEDVRYLRGNLEKIISNQQYNHSLVMMLKSQENNVYATVQNDEKGIIIKAKAIKYERVLGSGAFGEVWKARIKSEFVAVKKIPKNLLDEESKSKLRAEAEVMKSLSHPGIVACIGVVDEDADFCLVMELCSMGSLDNMLKMRKDLSLRVRIDLALDIANAMSYLHRLNVVHRDLKPGNIVLDDNMRPKITDFGLAFAQSATMTSFRGTEMGTPAFMAPECFGLTPLYSTRSDVYSFSIIIWELMHMQQAYHGVTVLEIRDSIKDGQRLAINESIPEDIRTLIAKCWEQNPRARPPFQDIVKTLRNHLALMYSSDPMPSMVKPHSVPSEKGSTNSDTAVTSKSKALSERISWPRQKKLRLIIISTVLIFILAGAAVGIAIAVNSGKSAGASNFAPSSTTIPTSSAAPTPASWVVSTFAGNGLQSVVDGSRLSASFDNPCGVMVDKNDTIFVTDCVGHTVRRIDTSGMVTTIAGIPSSNGYLNGLAKNSQFYLPYQMCRRSDGTLIIADKNNNAIRGISADYARVVTVAGNGADGDADNVNGTRATFSDPLGVACDTSGNIYVSDSGNNKIRKIDVNGSVTTLMGNSSNFGRRNGAFADVIICGPREIVYSPKTNSLYFAEQYCGGYARQVDLSANIVSNLAGNPKFYDVGYLDGPALLARFGSMYGIGLDHAGNIYMTENDQSRIRMLNYTTGVVSTVSGFNGTAGYVDGLATGAYFSSPKGIAVDSKGNIYIADQNNNVIRKISR